MAEGCYGFTPEVPMATGVVHWFNEARGYGFIEPTDIRDNPEMQGDRIFVHYADILGRGYRSLRPGQPVRYSIQTVRGAARAVEVEAL